MNFEPVRILVDRREQSGALYRALTVRDDVALSIGTLDAGDYLVEDRVTIERKTVNDFRGTLGDGRLFRQAAFLKANAPRPLFLIEGAGLSHVAASMYQGVRGALVSLSVMWYLPVLWALSADEGADILVTIGRQWFADNREKWLGPPRAPRRQMSPAQSMLCCIEGLGPRAANDLLNHFGSMRAIAQATSRDLVQVHGIGPVLSKRIQATLGSHGLIPPTNQDPQSGS